MVGFPQAAITPYTANNRIAILVIKRTFFSASGVIAGQKKRSYMSRERQRAKVRICVDAVERTAAKRPAMASAPMNGEPRFSAAQMIVIDGFVILGFTDCTPAAAICVSHITGMIRARAAIIAQVTLRPSLAR